MLALSIPALEFNLKASSQLREWCEMKDLTFCLLRAFVESVRGEVRLPVLSTCPEAEVHFGHV